MKLKSYTLVLGSYINGYSVIRELYDKGIRSIALFSNGKSLAWYSNKVDYKQQIDKTPESLKEAIYKLKKITDFIIIFPTDDLQLENLHRIYNDIKDFCFIPFNNENIIQSLDKYYQYQCCEEFKIPYPKTVEISSVKDVEVLKTMMFPVLIKPNKRKDATTSVFRSLFLESNEKFELSKELLEKYISEGITFLASEYIPGDDTNIFAYVGYRSKKGEILNEWIGKKLTQFPDKFGVFSSASNEAPEVLLEQGRILLNKMNLFGIAEPEFKFDHRDGKYKLMEINLRSMMWHRMGNLSGVNIQFTQYLDAIGKQPESQKQLFNPRIHMVYLKHEIINLIFRKGYWKHFKYNIWGGDKRVYSAFEQNDMKPFIFDFVIGFIKEFILQCLKRLNVR